MRDYNCFVYILTNKSHTVLYTGVTSQLEQRLYEHRHGLTPGFATRYRCHKLVWYEATPDMAVAIAREKQIKAGSRAKKIALINALNPEWKDLFPEA